MTLIKAVRATVRRLHYSARTEEAYRWPLGVISPLDHSSPCLYAEFATVDPTLCAPLAHVGGI
jgi:hypothetical protein